MSGTSMSAPMVSAGAALLLQKAQETGVNLTPDQVKYRLMATANKTWPAYNAVTAGAGYLDIYAALTGTTTEAANSNLKPATCSPLARTRSPGAVSAGIRWVGTVWAGIRLVGIALAGTPWVGTATTGVHRPLRFISYNLLVLERKTL